MGICEFCAQPAGFLRKQHKECLQKHTQAQEQIQLAIQEAYQQHKTAPQELETLRNSLNQRATSAFIDPSLQQDLIAKGVGRAIETALEDGLLSVDEEERIKALVAFFQLSQEILDKWGYYTRLMQAYILRQVMEGVLPQCLNLMGDPLPFVFQKGEKLIWVEQGVAYYETKTTSRYVGGSQGVSVRIMKGVYYRVGAFKGRRIQEDQLQYVDTGVLAITTKNLYFGGKAKSVRIPFAKLVSISPYEDGISVHKEGANAKPQVFYNGDSWFLYNLIANLNNLG
ncbi:hypothetical protein ACFOPX_04135 [Helicobacter baculiformis]|uniref:Uncharacterized protein n=1 Tax=Helicobacter baculiformis TaxID=427351 RepID=A0ABV7ZHZ0_9HELI|nr:hypothetical protein [Helicobacter baculiformis]